MNTKDIRLSDDPDLAGSWAAMQRAGNSAIDMAIQTNTAIITMAGDKIVRITAEELIKQRQAEHTKAESPAKEPDKKIKPVP